MILPKKAAPPPEPRTDGFVELQLTPADALLLASALDHVVRWGGMGLLPADERRLAFWSAELLERGRK